MQRRGFKSGVYNLTNPVQPVVKPETLDAFELGVKSDLLDRRLRLNVAGFYYQYKNIQLFQVTARETVLGNAAKAKLYGVDVDVVASFGGGLRRSPAASSGCIIAMAQGRWATFQRAWAACSLRDRLPATDY